NLCFGAHNALRQRRWRNEKCPGNLLCCQAANFTQRERYPSFRRQSGMAAGKDETEAVVLDFLIGGRRLADPRLEVKCEVFLCAVKACAPAHCVYSFEACG